MTEPNQEPDQPGKTRTWWHPLLARLLSFAFAGFCEVVEELPVGKLPMRVDILLVHLLRRRPTPRAKRCARSLVGVLNEFTLIEFKSPTDAIERGDLLHFLACTILWLEQQETRPAKHKVSMLLLAPSLNAAFRADARYFKCRIRRKSRGVYEVLGLPFETWFVETDEVVERNEPLLSLVSDELLNKRQQVIETLKRGHFDELLEYTVQQVSQFQTDREAFAMRHAKTEVMDEVAADLRSAVLDLFSPEERLRGLPPEERLRGLPPEERLRGLPPEERLRGLPIEERLRDLDEEQMKQLRELLNRRMATSERSAKDKRR